MPANSLPEGRGGVHLPVLLGRRQEARRFRISECSPFEEREKVVGASRNQTCFSVDRHGALRTVSVKRYRALLITVSCSRSTSCGSTRISSRAIDVQWRLVNP